MNNLKILFGVCGIGRGHIYEMLPIIEHYISMSNSSVVIFSFGESYKYFTDKYKNSNMDNILVLEVIVPWIYGSPNGIDYALTAKDEQNQRRDYITKNFNAMERAERFLGKPSVIVTDYEPVSAMYAYSRGSKLITVDQQSKYFLSGYPSDISGLTPHEERSRMGMFFPRADLRIINSFFKFPSSHPELLIDKFVSFGPVIRDEIASVKNDATENSVNVLVYLSPYSPFVQKPRELLRIFKQIGDFRFYVFTASYDKYKRLQKKLKISNVYIRQYNEENFLETLKICKSAISSAGHTLLSELMFLEKPVLTVPLNTYEQHYSAWIIGDGHYGMTAKRLSVKNIRDFLDSLDEYKHSIRMNKNKRLYNKSAQSEIVKAIDNIIKK